MDKTYNHKVTEARIYAEWEKSGAFQPNNNPQAPAYSIVLPPPNANGDLHIGHAMYVVEDILIRYHRMKGDSTLWLAGADHAGFETQYVFEKHLAKQGKSRFDYTRENLYQTIYEFVMENRQHMESQLRRLGFSLDWSRNVFTLDPEVIKIVYRTFKHLYDEGLVYRGERLVNYCTRCGTSFSDLEVVHVEKKDPLIYMKYGPFTIATVRPETKFRDTALAVNPKDKRYRKWIGKTLEIQGLLGPISMTVVADDGVDPDFGTGIMKVTPAHDFHDYELGKKYNLPITPIIDRKGKMDFSWFLEQKDKPQKYLDRARSYHGVYITKVRRMMLEDLKADGLLVKIDKNYEHSVGTCYRCGTILEPTLLPQWYVSIRPLAQKAVAAGRKGKIKVFPHSRQKMYYQWLDKFIDWNISRQIVWGIRIPAWQCESCEIWTVTAGNLPGKCGKCGHQKLIQDPDTFDTWFSSAQWPYATLETSGKYHQTDDLQRFYPLSVMETGYDILPAWVCRMVMIGLFETKKEPFSHIFLHGLVRDARGQKMSKSKGNVVNPLEIVDKYGADALRFALVFGTASGADVPFAEDKTRGMRNFANKLWNIGRFIFMYLERENTKIPFYIDNAESRKSLHPDDKQILAELTMLINKVTDSLDAYRFNDAAESLYEFAWHTFADKHIENAKSRMSGEARSSSARQKSKLEDNVKTLSVMRHVYLVILKLLHPFMPFVTEEIWSKMPRKKTEMLIVSAWPK